MRKWKNILAGALSMILALSPVSGVLAEEASNIETFGVVATETEADYDLCVQDPETVAMENATFGMDFGYSAVECNRAVEPLTLEQLRDKFPDGKYWNHADNPGAENSKNNQDGYTELPCTGHGRIGTSEQTCNAFMLNDHQYSWQCMGYAEKCGYDTTGYNPRVSANGWSVDKSVTALDSLKPGDIVRYRYDGHSIFITDVEGDIVTFTDCNWDGHCGIRWGATITKADLAASFSYVCVGPGVKGGGIGCGCTEDYAGTYKVTSSTSLNMRAGHGTNYYIIGSIPAGATVEVTKANGTWAHVTYNGVTGFVSMLYLSKENQIRCNLDEFTLEDGKLSLVGWAFDKDDYNATMKVTVYVGGTFLTGKLDATFNADALREDVDETFKVGKNHGIEYSYDTSLWGENIPVYVYAENAKGARTLLGSGKFTNIFTTVYKDVDYKNVYNYYYYKNAYPELEEKLGTDEAKYLEYFVTEGMSLGQQASKNFSPYGYANKYPDIRHIFKNNMIQYYLHYIKHGKAEYRDGKGSEIMLGATTVLNGLDYSAVYDYNFYVDEQPDVKAKYGLDDAEVLKHYVQNDMILGISGNDKFDVYSYAYRYADLRAAFGNNLQQYFLHFIRHGKNEGRQGTGTTEMQNIAVVYNGVDYSAVYNYEYYTEHNETIKKLYGIDDFGTLKYFVEQGMAKTEQANESFDAKSYVRQYADLRRAFGTNYSKYYLHYINFGKKEGRKGTGTETLQNPTTVLNGVDYSAVYDYNYYIESKEEFKDAYSLDDLGLLQNFVEQGMAKAEQAKESFDITSYAYKYTDLRRAFKNNYKSYYMHYISFGEKEGRVATGTDAMVNPAVTYGNIDYSLVYDYNYYAKKYVEIPINFGFDDLAALQDFVENGMAHGRQGIQSFNVYAYKKNYADLQNAFGENLKAYYMHYISFGHKEGRKGE